MALKADRAKLDEKVWERPSPAPLSSKAYLQEDLALPKEALDLLKEKLDGYTEDSFRFVVHVMASGQIKNDRWAPVSKKFIDAFLIKAEKTRLVEDGILEMKLNEFVKRRSKEWRLALPLEFIFSQLIASSSSDCVNAKTGRRRKPAVFSATTKNRNPLPPLILGAREALKYGYFNKDSVENYLAELDAYLNRALDTQDGLSLQHHMQVHENATKLLARYSNDARCYAAIRCQKPELLQGSTYRYPLAYTVQKTGRLSQVGGGAQACSRRMKAALYESLDGVKQCFNYDLKSSQAFILRALLGEAGLDTSWIDTYLKADRKAVAQSAGLTEEVWKEALNAVVMGADLPSGLKYSKEDSTLRRAFYNAHYAPGPRRENLLLEIGDGWEPNAIEAETIAEKAYQDFRKEVKPFYSELTKWRKQLKLQWINHGKNNRGGKSLPNAVGVYLSWTRELKDKGSEKRAMGGLAAFVLQGKEAAFIHRLTALLPEHGVIPISNEHDGIVTLGSIPKRLIDQVKQEMEMPYAKLVDKPFV